MIVAANPPPPAEVRLFVGNLVPSITDVALLRLLSRFGHTSKFERNTTEGFAHLSIKPKNDLASDDIDRCISSLNRTSWCSTTLRVERAREHFQARLEREWAEQRNMHCDDTKMTDAAPSEDHFKNMKKGKHTKFSFSDIAAIEPFLPMQSEAQCDTDVPQELISDAASNTKSNVIANRLKGRPNSSSSKSVKLDSTLELFGLSSSQVDRKSQVGEQIFEKKRSQPVNENIPRKRTRNRAPIEQTETEEGENQHLFDIGSEQKKANRVLQKLFPEPEITGNSAKWRRAGLYRRLVPTREQVSGDNSVRVDERDRKATQPRFRRTEQSLLNDAGEGKNPAERFRRAGLYRMLQSGTSAL